jgi:4'-phosphopantetheinyl transferase EntD
MLGRVEPKLWREVFRAEEIDRLNLLSDSQQVEIATAMFSAKEAFYKCQFTLTRRWLEFKDVCVEMGTDSFRIRICRNEAESPLLLRPLYGKFLVDATRVVSGIAIQT